MRFVLAALLIFLLLSPPAQPPGPAGGTPIPNPTPTATPPIADVVDARAVWERPDRARISWLADRLGALCVDRLGPPRVLVGCGVGQVVDPAPRTGNIYVLYGSTELARLELRGRALLPIARRP